MTSKLTLTCLVAVIVVMRGGGASAQSGCSSTLINLYPCLNYVTGNSSSPSSTCCSQLASVVQAKPQCLCLLVNGGASPVGININQTLALELPDACNVQTPSASKCNAGSGQTSPAATPASSPEGSPADSSNGTPKSSVSDTPEGKGSKTVPTTDGSSSSGGKMKASFQLLASLLFITSYALAAATF